MKPDPVDTFTVFEYLVDPKRVIDHAIKTGRTVVVVRPDGSVRVVISVPRPDPVNV